VRKLLLLIPLFLPSPLKRVWYRRILGWKIGRRVKIGLSYLEAAYVEIGDDVHIGHFNVMKAVRRFVVGPRTHISNFNMFSGNHMTGPGWLASVSIGPGCYVMSHHHFDLGGEIVIGAGSTLAGRDTHLWTHTIRIVEGKPELTPLNLRLGEGCYIGARATLLFCSLPDGCMVGAGSVVTRSFEPASGRLLIAGNPAVVCKTYPPLAPPPTSSTVTDHE